MAICFTVTLLPVPPVYLDFDASNVKVNRPELVESFFFASLDESSPSNPAQTGLIQASLLQIAPIMSVGLL